MTAVILTMFSAIVRAPLLGLADVNQTPNPSKAPWYFLGLQELLTMFHPMVAGVTIPGMGIFLLMVAPYIDKNPSNKPEDRKFAISLMTIFLMFWATLVIIGSFFRGPGFNFTLPWRDGIFFELWWSRIHLCPPPFSSSPFRSFSVLASHVMIIATGRKRRRAGLAKVTSTGTLSAETRNCGTRSAAAGGTRYRRRGRLERSP